MMSTRAARSVVMLSLFLALSSCSGAANQDAAIHDVVAGRDAAGETASDARLDVGGFDLSPPSDVPAENTEIAPADTTTDLPLPDADSDAGDDTEPTAVVPTVRFDPDAEDFFDSPFPSLLRTLEGGTPDYSSLPNPKGQAIVTAMIEASTVLIDGASPNGAIYFGLTAALDPVSLPDLEGSLTPEAAVFLVDVDPESPTRGQRTPARVHQVLEAHDGYVDPPVLVVQPLFGFPLRERTRYAAVVTTGVLAADGEPLATPPLMAEILADQVDGPIVEAYAPLLALLDEQAFPREQVAAATVFRTLNATGELRALREHLYEAQPVPEIVSLELAKEKDDYLLYYGRLLIRNFQSGVPPYTSGGGFAYGAEGLPVSFEEEIDFSLSVPRAPAATPGGGVPVLLYSHGTGGSFKSVYSGDVARHMAGIGYACVGIDQPLHGTRWVGSSNSAMLELAAFNFLNPEAGATGFREAALELVQITRLVREGPAITLPGAERAPLAFSPDHVVFFGHSQGGLVGPPFLAIEPHVRAGVISAGGGVLLETILYRENGLATATIREMVASFLKIEDADSLERWHPVLTLVQNMTDLTDPINYAGRVNQPGNRKHIMQTMGLDDGYTPPETAENLALAWNLPFLETDATPVVHVHPGYAIKGFTHLTPPVTGNVALSDGSAATGFIVQYANAGHFPVFSEESARALYLGMFSSLLLDDPPVVDPP
jgi:pimeloyl-ACP methyl ester carboxylesterase